MNRPSLTRRGAIAASAMLCFGGAWAQAGYPERPVRLVVPFPPAGGTDILSRMVAEEVTQKEKWNFIIDNRPGAGGNIGLDLVARAKNDAYTLGTGQTSNLAINPALYPHMPFDAAKDFEPVVLLASQPVVLVVRLDSKIQSLADLKREAQARSISMASAGTGTVSHVGGEMFANRAGFKVAHIPYKGAGPAITDLLGGQTDIYFGTPPSVLPMVKAGKLRAIAVTSPKRIPILPDTPTVAESGYPGFVAEDWKAVVAPRGTPPEAIRRINEAMNAALARPRLIARLLEEGSTPRGGTAQQLRDFMKTEYVRWGNAVRESGAKPE